MDRPGERFLAGARLADDQHRQPVAGGLGGHRERGAEIGRAADQLFEFQGQRKLLGHRRELTRGAAAIGIGGKRFEQAFGRNRAHEEVGRAGAHGFDRDRHRVSVG